MKLRPSLRVPVLALALAAPALLAVRPAGAQDAPAAPPAQAQEPPAAAPAGDKITLAVRMAKGDVVWFRQAVKTEQDMDMGGMQMATSMEMNQNWSQTCDAVNDKGAMSVRVKYARLWGSMTNPMLGEMKFDSDAPAQDQENPMLAGMTAALTALAGQELKSTLLADGSMTEISAGGEKADPEQAKALEEMSSQLEGLTGYPKGPVGVGDTWDVKKTLRMQGMGITVDIKCKLTAFDAESATVSMTGTMSMAADDAAGEDAGDPRAAAMREMMKSMKMTDSSMKGVTRFSRKDGLILATDVDQSMTMSMDLPAEAAEQGMGGGMKISQKIKVKAERTDAPPAKEKPAAETPSAPPAEGEKKPDVPAGPGSGEK